MTETLGTYHIPDRNLEALRARVEKLNKRALKLEAQPITLTPISHEDIPHVCGSKSFSDPYGWCSEGRADRGLCRLVGTVRRVWTVEVTGTTPKYAGWAFVATIEHTPDGNIVRCLPGKELPVEFRDTKSTRCDQCLTERDRRDTYVVAKGDEHRQVGSSCIKDFLGHNDPQALAAWAEALGAFNDDLTGAEDDDWGFGGGGSGDEFINGPEFLGHVAACVRTHGWLSRGKARENGQFNDGPTYATADRAVDNLFPTNEDRAAGKVIEVTTEDKDRAAAALGWAEHVLDSLPDSELNDYLHNLRTITKAFAIKGKHVGIYASLLLTAEREGEKVERIAAERAAAVTRKHVGEVGKREVFKNLTVKFTHGFEGGYGLTTLISFRDADDNAIVWFRSGGEGELTQGAVVDLKATVKAHENKAEYGVQTIITRGKVERVIEEGG